LRPKVKGYEFGISLEIFYDRTFQLYGHGFYGWHVYEPSLRRVITPLPCSLADDTARDTLATNSWTCSRFPRRSPAQAPRRLDTYWTSAKARRVYRYRITLPHEQLADFEH